MTKPRISLLFGILTVFSLTVLTSVESVEAAKKTPLKRPITKPRYNPKAEKVELFSGMEDGSLEAYIISKDSKNGFLFVENKTNKPLTVQLPKGVVGVQVLNQPGFGGQVGGGNGQFGGQQGGQQQNTGGGFGGGNQLGGGQFGGQQGGGNFFSIPAEKVVRVPYHSVCLQHGKPEPSSRSRYRVTNPEDYTEKVELQELIEIIGTNKIDPKIAQAAAWHLTDNMSWQELANKRVNRLGGVGPTPYFSYQQLVRAQTLVKIAQKQAADRPAKPETTTTSRSQN